MPETVEAEVVPPSAGSAAIPAYPAARNAVARVILSREATWFAWGMIAGAAALGIFLWQQGRKKRE